MRQQTEIKEALKIEDSIYNSMKFTFSLSIVAVALLCVAQSSASDAEIALSNDAETVSPIANVAAGSDALTEVDALNDAEESRRRGGFRRIVKSVKKVVKVNKVVQKVKKAVALKTAFKTGGLSGGLKFGGKSILKDKAKKFVKKQVLQCQ